MAKTPTVTDSKPTTTDAAPAVPAPTRETIHVLQPTYYALGESLKMTGSWTNPTATPGPVGGDVHGPDLAIVDVTMGSDARATLPDGRVRFTAATQEAVWSIQTRLQGISRDRKLTIETPICLNSTVARATDAVRGPVDVASVAHVENGNFPLLALRLAKPTPVLLETDADGKRRLIIEID